MMYIFQSFLILIYFKHAVLCYTELSSEHFIKCDYNKNNNLSENIEECVDAKLYQLKDELIQKFEKTMKFASDIGESLDKMKPFTTQTPETGIPSTKNEIHKSFENINRKLDTMESTLQNSINNKFLILENNINEKIKELSDTIKTLFPTNTKQLTENIDLTSKEKTVHESTETIVDKGTNDQDRHITKEISNTSDIIISPRKKLETFQETNMTDSQYGVLHTLCDFEVPKHMQSSINTSVLATPPNDDIDRLVINKTGCNYRAVNPYSSFSPPGVPFNGTGVEFHIAVRGLEKAYMNLDWNNPAGPYSFLVGAEDNTVTYFYQFEPSYHRISEQSTPEILSHDRYVPFYIKIHEGTLTFGKICDREAIFTHNVTIPLGEEVTVSLRSHSHYGAKYIYDCPAGPSDGS